jgi:hypothetical protein
VSRKLFTDPFRKAPKAPSGDGLGATKKADEKIESSRRPHFSGSTSLESTWIARPFGLEI